MLKLLVAWLRIRFIMSDKRFIMSVVHCSNSLFSTARHISGTQRHLGPCQTSIAEGFFSKTMALAVSYFQKNLHHRYLTGF